MAVGVYWIVLVCAVLGALQVVNAGDPDPLQDFCVADLESKVVVNGYPCKARNLVTSKDFTFTGFRKALNPTSVSETGATADLASVVQFPALNTQGLTHARLDFDIGGVIPLHTHPRASETLLVLKGSIYTGFISDDNQLFASVLEVGDFTIFPRASQHFQLNVGNETAITFNTLNSQSPGFLFTSNQIFQPNITKAVIERSFGINSSTVNKLKEGFPKYWSFGTA